MGCASPKMGDPAMTLVTAIDSYVRPAANEGRIPDEDAIAGLLGDALDGPHHDEILHFLASIMSRVAQGICPDLGCWP